MSHYLKFFDHEGNKLIEDLDGPQAPRLNEVIVLWPGCVQYTVKKIVHDIFGGLDKASSYFGVIVTLVADNIVTCDKCGAYYQDDKTGNTCSAKSNHPDFTNCYGSLSYANGKRFFRDNW